MKPYYDGKITLKKGAAENLWVTVITAIVTLGVLSGMVTETEAGTLVESIPAVAASVAIVAGVVMNIVRMFFNWLKNGRS